MALQEQDTAVLPISRKSCPSPVDDAADTMQLVDTITSNGNKATFAAGEECQKSFSKLSNISRDAKHIENGHAPKLLPKIAVPGNHVMEQTDEDKQSKSKKHVNICTDQEEMDEEDGNSVIETTALRRASETSDSVADHSAISSTDGCLTMTGTIKRGKKAGQSVDVKLNISREELEVLDAEITARRSSSSPRSFVVNAKAGPHILIYTLLFMPLAFILSGIYSFYVGTMTWYNVFTYYTEEKPVIIKMLVSPFLILFYPFLIILFALGLGLYAGFVQISWYFERWQREITDWEKGFYGWLCAALKHEDCSPYEVVVLTEIQEHELLEVGHHHVSGLGDQPA